MEGVRVPARKGGVIENQLERRAGKKKKKEQWSTIPILGSKAGKKYPRNQKKKGTKPRQEHEKK